MVVVLLIPRDVFIPGPVLHFPDLEGLVIAYGSPFAVATVIVPIHPGKKVSDIFSLSQFSCPLKKKEHKRTVGFASWSLIVGCNKNQETQ